MSKILEQEVRLIEGQKIPHGVRFHAADVIILAGDSTRCLQNLPVIRRENDGNIYYVGGTPSDTRVAILSGDIVVKYSPKLSE